MNNKIINMIILLSLLFPLTVSAKILIIAEKGYYDDCNLPPPDQNINRVERYANAVDNIDGKEVDLVHDFEVTTVGMVNQCTELWEKIVERYNQSIADGDIIEGAVLIGDLPVPLFIYPGGIDADYVHPVEYFFMDLGYESGGTFIDYSFPGNVWKTITTSNGTYFDRDFYKTPTTPPPNTGLGDEELEIWASRIYGKTLKHLRGKDAQPGDWGPTFFLEEHEIINEYLDRVHERMTQRANVPPRGFLMGHPSNFNSNCEYWLGFQNLNLLSLNYFDWEDDPTVNRSHNWQSQLQAGPYGNINYGAFKGTKFDTDPNCEKDNRIAEYENDTKGYEWAGVFAHSGPNGHAFHESYFLHRGGGFGSIIHGDKWDKVDNGTGWHGGSYYTNRRRKDIEKELAGYCTDKIYQTVKWTYKIPANGTYDMYMYYNASADNDAGSYFCIKKKDFVSGKLFERSINLQDHLNEHPTESNWELLNLNGHFSLNAGDSVYVMLTAGPEHDPDPNIADITIADAIWFDDRSGSGPSSNNVVDNDDDGFECDKWKDRSFLSMRDDGGPSKSQFFVGAACCINPYNYTENLGLLYAMGHNGLIMMGNSYFNGSRFIRYTENIGKGDSFGEAYFKQSNEFFNSPSEAFILLGAGTLKAQPYYHYSDSKGVYLFITESNIDKKQTYFAQHIAQINNASSIVIGNGASTTVYAGDLIKILPEFHAEYGSELHLEIIPAMAIDPPSL